MKVAIYPGTFDPVTNGHINILKRGASIFDKVIVGVALDNDKKPLFSIEERIGFLKNVIMTEGFNNVEVECFDGLLMHFVDKKRSSVILRGLRAVSDFEYEFQLALMNKKLNPKVETVFLASSSKYAFISSTIIKKIVSLNGEVLGLIPLEVEDAIKKKFSK